MACGPRIIVAIDFTNPNSINNNDKFYNKVNITFIRGSIGGDCEKLIKYIDKKNQLCVIEPNMDK